MAKPCAWKKKKNTMATLSALLLPSVVLSVVPFCPSRRFEATKKACLRRHSGAPPHSPVSDWTVCGQRFCFITPSGLYFGPILLTPLGARRLARFFFFVFFLGPDALVSVANRTAEASSGENHLEPRRIEIKIISGHLFLPRIPP